MMIIIEADHLSDGLYNIKDGEIYKYKANGGTARNYKIRFEKVVDAVAPSRPSGGWTSWKDGLPDCDVEVLVTDGTFVWIDELESDGDMYWWDCQNVAPETTAWMYLPEPYKESE